MDKDFEGQGGNREAAQKVGAAIAKKAIEKGIKILGDTIKELLAK